MKILHQLLMLLDKDEISFCVAAALTAMKVANPAIRIQIFFILLWDQMLMVLQLILERTRRHGKIVQLQSLEELLLTMYTQVHVVSPDKFRSLFPHHIMHGSTSFLKLFFVLL